MYKTNQREDAKASQLSGLHGYSCNRNRHCFCSALSGVLDTSSKKYLIMIIAHLTDNY